ncbi:MAG: N-acetyltransferase family protein [Hydrogeniiclostridium mannosilyticum]
MLHYPQKGPPGVEAKRAWLAQRLREGHVFRKLDTKGVVFIEYAPLETAWAPVEGENYLYIYCLWVSGEFKGKGYGRHLMEYCLADAKSREIRCVYAGCRKQRPGSDQAFAAKHGFETVDTTRAAIGCWPAPLTEPSRTLRRMPSSWRSKART